jgi:hypothetical protein
MVLILLYANKLNTGGKNYLQTLNYWGYQYKIVGQGDSWTGFISTKITRLLEYLRTVDPKLLVCVTDVFDVYACDTPQELVRKFNSFNCDLVISAESLCGGNCFPLEKTYWKKRIILPKNKYCNGGSYMGFAKNLIEMFEFMIKDNNSKNDDQLSMGHFISLYPNKVKLDSGQLITGNLTYNIWDYSVSDKKIKYRDHNINFLHIPGSNVDFYLRYNYFGKQLLPSFLPMHRKITLPIVIGLITIGILLYSWKILLAFYVVILVFLVRFL